MTLKHILFGILAVLLAAVFCIAPAAAAESTCDHSTWIAWTETTELPTEAGNYYLENDVEINSTWRMPVEISLCLNGHDITFVGSEGSVIEVLTTFNLYDCENRGIITGGKYNQGAGIAVLGTFNMYGGNITGNTADVAGGGVHAVLSDATFNMYGGTITNNTAYTGGGVDIAAGATFIMYGGVISDNYAEGFGSGVSVTEASFIMSGGAIATNYNDAIGSGIYSRNSEFIMYDGLINNSVYMYENSTFKMYNGTITRDYVMVPLRSCDNCVDIFDIGTFEMYGGNISGNIDGCGVGVVDDGMFIMSGGSISNNIAVSLDGGGSGVDVMRNGTFIMSGGSITNNTDRGVVVTDRGTFTVSGMVNIIDNSPYNVYLWDNANITIDPAGLIDSTIIRVSTFKTPTLENPITITGTNNADYSKNFFSDNSSYHIENINNVLYLAVNNTEPTTYITTISTSGNGTASAAPNPATAGTQITLTATPNDGYSFKEWQVEYGGITIEGNTFTMPASDVSIKAVFEPEAPDVYYHVIPTTEPGGEYWFSHSEQKAGEPVTVTKGNMYPGNTFVKFVIESVDGETFYQELTGTGTFIMPACDVVVRMISIGDPHNIIISSDIVHGVITTDPTDIGETGKPVVITAIPESGYELHSITVTNLSGGVSPEVIINSYGIAFFMPNADVEISATFTAIDEFPSLYLLSVPSVVIQGQTYGAEGIAKTADTVRYYIFGTNYFEQGEATVSDDEFIIERESNNMEAGQYFMVIQHPMYDKEFNVQIGDTYPYPVTVHTNNQTNVAFTVADRQGANAAQALCDELDSLYFADTYVKFSFVVEQPMLTMHPLPYEITKGTKLVVSGMTNLGERAVITVEMVSTAFSALPRDTIGAGSFIAHVVKAGVDGSWEVTFDTSGLNVDEYQVSAEIEGFGKTISRVNVIEARPTATPTPIEPSLPPSIPLKSGWNFISIPKYLDASCDTAGELLANLNTSGYSHLGYNAEIGEWYTLQRDTPMQPLNAYWVYTTEPAVLNLTYSTKINTPPAMTVYKGWNAVGLCAETSMTAKSTFTHLDWVRYLPWNLTSGKWGRVIVNGGSMENSEELRVQLGNGGWLYVEEDGVYLGNTA